eukprot:PhM_4_TR14205/c1_g2_i14/m.70241
MFLSIIMCLFVAASVYTFLQDLGTPGPMKWPLVGSLPNALMNSHRLHDYFLECFQAQRGRVIFFHIRPYRLWLTTDRENVVHILKTNWTNYGASKGPRALALGDLLGHGIFLADGDNWKRQRKTVSVEFNAQKFRTFTSLAFVSYAQRLCDVVDKNRKAGKAMKLVELFPRLTLDAFGFVAFGVDLKGLTGAPVPFATAFDAAQANIMHRVWKSHPFVWKSQRFLNVGPEKEMKKNMAMCREFVSELIRTRRELPDAEREQMCDLLTRLMSVGGSDVELQDMVMNFMVAGRDTTACTLSWLFYELCRHPDVEARLVQEIAEELHGEAPNFDNIKDCHYLQACLSETLRVHPPVAMGTKTVVARDVLPSGHVVEPGDTVTYVVYSMCRSEELWGPDATLFRPSRFLNADTGEYERVDQFTFPAFQAGPRLCLGVEMAHLEMKLATVCLLQRFRFALVDKESEAEVGERLSLVSWPSIDVTVTVSPR